MSDAIDLERFVLAQNDGDAYATARTEIRDGEKRSHWIWFVFPQVAGLGSSAMSRAYSITGLDEARAFLAHPVLGRRLHEITELVNERASRSAREIFHGDDVKFHSCMTLFSLAAPQDAVFRAALDLFFDGKRDQRTESILAAASTTRRAGSP